MRLRSAPSGTQAPEEAQPIVVAEFVSESDVREAMGHGAKIFIGPKTIVTPSARDLGSDHEIFVVIDLLPGSNKPCR